jgi:hypothetical protein
MLQGSDLLLRRHFLLRPYIGTIASAGGKSRGYEDDGCEYGHIPE